VLQNSLVRSEVLGGGHVTGDQANGRELRKSLLRKPPTDSTSSVTEEELDDTVTGVSDSQLITLHCVTVVAE